MVKTPVSGETKIFPEVGDVESKGIIVERKKGAHDGLSYSKLPKYSFNYFNRQGTVLMILYYAFLFLFTIITGGLGGLIALYVYYRHMRKNWATIFKNRPHRNSEESPCYGKHPALAHPINNKRDGFTTEEKSDLIRRAEVFGFVCNGSNDSTIPDELTYDTTTLKNGGLSSDAVRKNDENDPVFNRKYEMLQRLVYPKKVWRHELTVEEKKAKGIVDFWEMDTLGVDLWQYINGYLTVGVNINVCAIVGFIKIIFRTYLKVFGCNRLPKAKFYDSQACELILETSISLGYFNHFQETVGGVDIGIHVFDEFPTINNDGEKVVIDKVVIRFDRKQRVIIDSKFYTFQPDSIEVKEVKNVSSRDIYCIFYCWLAVVMHPKLHAFANWGTTADYDIPDSQALQKSSEITIQYNYFGFSTGPPGFAGIHETGKYFHVFPKEIDTKHYVGGFVNLVKAGLSTGIDTHGQLVHLYGISDFAYFIGQTRHIFAQSFGFEGDDLRQKMEKFGLDPDLNEPLFVGTIMHSIDHFNAKRVGYDPLWLEAESHEYLFMGTIARITALGFTDDLPLTIYPTRMKDNKFSFYQRVYRGAKVVNSYLADNMDTCICK